MIKKKISGILAVSAILCATGMGVEANAVEKTSEMESGSVMAVSARATTSIGQVTANNGLNMRANATINSSILKVLPYGTKVNIQYGGNGWYYIEHNGVYGHVSGQYLKKISNISNGDTAMSSKGKVNAVSGLNMRKSPSTGSAIIKTLSNGTTFDIVSKSGSWYKIMQGGVEGYVHVDYVTIVNSSSGPSSDGTAMSSTGIVKTSSGLGVNMRKSPSTSSSIVMGIQDGAKVSITSKEGAWYKVSYTGNVGYVHSDYLKISGSSSDSSTGDSSVSGTGMVRTSSGMGVNMRKSPSTSGAIIRGLTEGTTFKITGKSGSWYKISFAGSVGYVHSDYVVLVNDSSAGNASSTYQKVLEVMKGEMGSPYVWGGNGEIITDSLISTLKKRFPYQSSKYDLIERKYYNSGYRAFDCSSLMQWSFRKVGINIGRTTYDQVYDGVGVSVKNAQPGDLLIFSNQEHVGMYIGNGKWIEAPYSGAYVRISDVPWSSIGYARRVIR